MDATNAPLCVGVIGASGRMGTMLLEQILASSDFRLTGAVVDPQSPLIGQVVGDTTFTADIATGMASCDVVIDFSLPDVTASVLQAVQSIGKPLVCGVTGLDAQTKAQMSQVAQTIPVFYASNMSVGIAVMRKAIFQMASALKETDAEILDLHHAQKRDAPSGTALALGQTIAAARGWSEDTFRFNRSADSKPRAQQQIGFASLRGGTSCGTHTVFFLGDDETLSVTHEATSRRIFASGALRAAKWIVGQTPGLYSMDDLLEGA